MPQPALKNDRLIRALLRQETDRTPAWIMRQAGRYLPEYRATRERAGNFLALCKTPELACEVTLQPLQRFAQLDAAILFSDILTIPDAMGLGLTMEEGIGPRFTRPLQSFSDAHKLGIPDPEDELGYVMDAVRLIRAELDGRVPLIGFAGSPWTLASYMIEGSGKHEFKRIKTWLYDQPEAMDQLLALLADAVAAYLNAQIKAGVQAVQIFDTWGGILSTPAFARFSLAPMQRILDQLQRDVAGQRIPVIVFTKGGGLWLEQLAATGADALGCDWSCDLSAARQRVGDKVALQGNLDPAVLLCQPATIRQEVHAVLNSYGPGPGHVFNLGHGITPDVPPEHLGEALRAVHAFRHD